MTFIWSNASFAKACVLDAAVSESRVSSQGGASWAEKCQNILQEVLTSLGIESQWFDRPVDEFYIPGYYSKIKEPMDLGTMKEKLNSSKYEGPEEFCKVFQIVFLQVMTYGHIARNANTWSACGVVWERRLSSLSESLSKQFNVLPWSHVTILFKAMLSSQPALGSRFKSNSLVLNSSMLQAVYHAYVKLLLH